MTRPVAPDPSILTHPLVSGMAGRSPAEIAQTLIRLESAIESGLASGAMTEAQADAYVAQTLQSLGCGTTLTLGDPVTLISLRILRTLTTLPDGQQPIISIVWSSDLPQEFRKAATRASILCKAIRFQHQDTLRFVADLQAA